MPERSLAVQASAGALLAYQVVSTGWVEEVRVASGAALASMRNQSMS